MNIASGKPGLASSNVVGIVEYSEGPAYYFISFLCL